jgi:Leucine-rich repeat (LRR) protein
MSASFATHVQCAFLTMVLCSNLFTATFCLSFFKAEPHVSCNEKEKQALLTLKRGLTDPGNLLASWSDQEDCCRWERVRCDSKTGRVTELHLSCPLDADGYFYDKKRLGGEISPSLLELGFLNYLDLSGDDFSRTHIPSFLGSMDSLRHLDLHSASFSGLIPHQLGNLSGLRYLDLGGYSDLYVDTLRWMSGLSSIQYLDLGYADLHREVDWLQIMSKFPSLLKLFLYNCQLDSLNPSLGTLNFKSLQVLDLSKNNFNHELPNWFSNLSTALLELHLDESSLKGEIPESLGQLKHLKGLSLSWNSFTGPIPQSLGLLTNLTYLDLSDNSFSGPIPSSLGNLSEMRVLNLQGNQLNGSVPKSLGLLSNLVALVIGYNVLTGTLDEAHFTKLSKLKNLQISSTPLFFNVNSNWVPPFQLEFADMSSCKIGPNFPTWLHTQRSLQVLLMSMSGISDKAPSWFWNWTSNIDKIDLSDNHIEGDVPDILLNSTILNLRSNHFKGRLPRLSANVKLLNIANNSIYGPISTFLCKKMNRKNKLEVLDVSNNFLSGEISHCWRYWQSLIHLNLGTNSLSGKIPYSMGSLVKLKSLRLQNNSFSGDIPSSLKKCSSLGLIDIGDNHLSGIIPLWVRKMRNLIILRLRSSGFKGKIPPKICQLSSLRILDLANNSLSGPIPNCLKNFSAMVLPDPLIKMFILTL